MQVQLDDFAMKCLKIACDIDPSQGERALKILSEEKPEYLKNASAWFVGLMRKRGWGFFAPKVSQMPA